MFLVAESQRQMQRGNHILESEFPHYPSDPKGTNKVKRQEEQVEEQFSYSIIDGIKHDETTNGASSGKKVAIKVSVSRPLNKLQFAFDDDKCNSCQSGRVRLQEELKC